MISYTPEMVIDLHFHVLNAIGISIKNGGYLVDQDTGINLSFEGKPLLYSYDVNRPVFDTEDTVKLDLINNIKMAENIFGYYINKIVADPDHDVKEIFTFFQIHSPDGTQSALAVKYLSKEYGRLETSSDYFCNNVLKYPALILLMEGDNFNVHPFDDLDLAKKKRKQIMEPLIADLRRINRLIDCFQNAFKNNNPDICNAFEYFKLIINEEAKYPDSKEEIQEGFKHL